MRPRSAPNSRATSRPYRDAEFLRAVGHVLEVALHHVAMKQQGGGFDVDHGGANALSIEAEARDVHWGHRSDPWRTTQGPRDVRAGQADDDCPPRRRPQARDMEDRNQPGDQRQRDAVHNENEQPQRHDGQRQREDEYDRPNERIHKPQQQRGDNQRTSAGDHDARQELVGDPQAQGGDQQSYEEASHGWEDNRCARPATNRAVIPGRACTPSLESIRMAPLAESRPESANETPAKGPKSAGQPLTIACSGWPNQLTASVSARGARNVICPRNTQSRPTTTVVVSRKMLPSRKRSLIWGASGNVSVSPRATTQRPA